MAEGNFYGFRAVSNVDYLSSFLFRLAFNEVFTQAMNSEVKSQLFLSKAVHGFSVGGMVERYQNFFQTTNPDGTLSISTDLRFHPDPAHSQCRRIQRGPAVLALAFLLVVRRLARQAFPAASPDFTPQNCWDASICSPEISLPSAVPRLVSAPSLSAA